MRRNRFVAVLISLALLRLIIVAGGLPVLADPSPQLARPVADVAVGEWRKQDGTTPIYVALDEVNRDDSDYVRSQQPIEQSPATVELSDLEAPGVDTGHVLRWTHRTSSSTPNNEITVTLMQGANQVAFRTVPASNSGFVQEQATLTEAEAALITDYSDLRIKLNARKVSGALNRQVWVSWLELEVPAAAPPPPPPPTCDIEISGPEVKTDHLIVPDGQVMCFAPGATLEMQDKSILVYGTLEMRPNQGHITFTGMDEQEFIGGGMGPDDPTDPCRPEISMAPCIDTDPGLWVMGNGVLDSQGTPKTSWTRDPASAAGWQQGDELRCTPIEPGDFTTFALYSSGDCAEKPESVQTQFGIRQTEVFNLDRDVVIRGQDSTHRAHIFIRSTQPQVIRYTEMQFLGPRKDAFKNGNLIVDGQKVTGRWAVHLHHMNGGSTGTVIEGNAVRDVGGHAIVAHASDGVLIQRNVAYNILEDAYWWDLVSEDPDTNSDGIDYVENLGAKVTFNFNSPDVGGMFFSAATNSTMTGNVMVGVKGSQSSDPGGYTWTTGQGAAWVANDNVAHNNNMYGGWVYGNPNCAGALDGFDVYNNGHAGWGFDSYDGGFKFEDLTSSGSSTGLKLKSVARTCESYGPTAFIRAKLHGASQAIKVVGHVKNATVPMPFTDCDLWGQTKVLIKENEGISAGFGKYDFIDCTADGSRDLETSDFSVTFLYPGSVYRLQQPDCEAWKLLSDFTWQSIPVFADTDTCTP